MKLKKIETPKEIKQALMTPFPNEVVLTKPGSKNKYISQETVTDKLNATFGFLGWSWDIQEKWIENSTPKIIKTKNTNDHSFVFAFSMYQYDPQGVWKLNAPQAQLLK